MERYKQLQEEAYQANMEVYKQRLVIYTWGNVSAYDPINTVFAIKPSGIPYEQLKPEYMVVVNLKGKVVSGTLRPSSDYKTHMVLYQFFKSIRGVTHTHSTYATAWGQTCQSVPVFGTTHADHTGMPVPCTPFISKEDLEDDYELQTGLLITKTINDKDPLQYPMILVAGHGPFTWGKSAMDSVYQAVVLEEICKMATITRQINPNTKQLPEYIIQKHWERKHGTNAYYGQKE